ncbi:HNH endonuclease, partial [Gordonia sp. N1V]|uniref:HNH endonuclease n=1 Tax=Gordonia sp. N1V TaxID=3034163 RepID=UPI0023E31498
ATAKLLSCDTTITKIMLDPNGVPLSVGEAKRFFTPGQRKALLVRDRGCIKCGTHAGRCQAHHVHHCDRGCIKCGAHAGRCQGHHLVHWSKGGPTDLDNGCLLCSSCHDDVHRHGWDIIMGFDRHPWLIPPAS